MEKMGTLPEREAMGHGPRGLQLRTEMPGTISPMTSLVPELTAGVKMAWAASATTSRRLCFALALWNERDPILKERLFGLTNSEGNHGEDVKEYYFYLDSTPTHSYMKYLYKYPQREFPYRDLVETNRRRSREEFEYELLDTGVFEDDRYFDVFVEYAKEGPEDILIRITAHNRGPEAARLRLLPTLWFRNTWSSGADSIQSPRCACGAPGVIQASHPELGDYWLYCDGKPGIAVYRKRDESTAAVGSAECFPVCQGCISPLCHRTETVRQ